MKKSFIVITSNIVVLLFLWVGFTSCGDDCDSGGYKLYIHFELKNECVDCLTSPSGSLVYQKFTFSVGGKQISYDDSEFAQSPFALGVAGVDRKGRQSISASLTRICNNGDGTHTIMECDHISGAQTPKKCKGSMTSMDVALSCECEPF